MDPSSSRRRGGGGGYDAEPLEEGEYIPGGRYYSSASESDTDDDDDSYYSLQPHREEEIHPQSSRVRRLEDILAIGRGAAALPSPTPSAECESDGTISDNGGSPSSAGVLAAPAMRPAYYCQVCGKGFGSPKAVGGHMRVHDPRGRFVAVDAGWAATGKRGCTGGSSKGKAVASSSAELSHSMDTVLQPMPLSFARSNPSSSSLSMAFAKTNLDSGESSSPKSVHNEPVPTLVANNNPSNEAVVHPPPPPAAQQAADHHQIVLQLAPAVPPPAAAAVQGHQQGPAAAAPRREYTCKLCGKSYPTHQGLGGHAAGHRNRQKEAEAAAAAAGFGPNGGAAARGGGKQEDNRHHPCKECDRVFATGVALGGHMRKHWKGGPIGNRRNNKKLCVAPPAPHAPPAVCMADLTLGLGIKSSGQPSQSPAAAAGRVRLFGIDIGLPAQAPAVRQGTVQQGTRIIPQAEALVVQQGTDTSRQAEAPAVQDEEGSAMTEDSACTGGQRHDEKVEKSSTDSLSKESSN